MKTHLFSSTRHAARGTRSPRRGAMAAELALLVLFVYVPLIIGSMYVSWLAVARQQVNDANHFTLLDEGDQTQDLGTQGEVSSTFFPEFTGQVAVEDTDAAQAQIPGPDELHDLFEEFTKPIHYRNVSARGSFYLDGSTVRYRETVNVNEGYRVRPEGQLVESWNLLDDEIPERITDLLVNYMRRRKAHANYVHSWVHDKDEVVAGNGTVGPWNLKVPNDATALRDEWNPECAVRWQKVRMAGDQTPPGASQRSEVGMPLYLADYEPAYDFWHPCEGWAPTAADDEDLPGPVEGIN